MSRGSGLARRPGCRGQAGRVYVGVGLGPARPGCRGPLIKLFGGIQLVIFFLPTSQPENNLHGFSPWLPPPSPLTLDLNPSNQSLRSVRPSPDLLLPPQGFSIGGDLGEILSIACFLKMASNSGNLLISCFNLSHMLLLGNINHRDLSIMVPLRDFHLST